MGITLQKEYVTSRLDAKRVSERIMSLKLGIKGVIMNVSRKCPRGDRGVIGGDFNGHVSQEDRRKNVTSQHQVVFCSIALKGRTG